MENAVKSKIPENLVSEAVRLTNGSVVNYIKLQVLTRTQVPGTPINQLDPYYREALRSIEYLNTIQSKLYPILASTNESVIVAAPTSSGKTILSLLATLSVLQTDDTAKVVYLAPMKSLITEVAAFYTARLESYGKKVLGLSSDHDPTQKQLSEASVIVSTPEKWEISLRKEIDRSWISKVSLVIFDEMHLLGTDRGPSLEIIALKTKCRKLGLSATMSNLDELAHLFEVKNEFIFDFDSSYRPVPIDNYIVALTNSQKTLFNETIAHFINPKEATLVFTHSRTDTIETAFELQKLSQMKPPAHLRQSLEDASVKIENNQLKKLVNLGFAAHHAGLSKNDRTIVEDLFKNGLVNVLVSTATLAWGVNLPANSVFIKGLEIINPSTGEQEMLSSMDILQMLGRAGRFGLSEKARGFIISSADKTSRVLKIVSGKFHIESQLQNRLSDLICAEVAVGNAASVAGLYELFSRSLYALQNTDIKTQIDNAVSLLQKCQAIDEHFLPTFIAKISSDYYIEATDVSRINSELISSNSLSFSRICEILAIPSEFSKMKHDPIKEAPHIASLINRLPQVIGQPGTLEAKIGAIICDICSKTRYTREWAPTEYSTVAANLPRLLAAIQAICEHSAPMHIIAVSKLRRECMAGCWSCTFDRFSQLKVSDSVRKALSYKNFLFDSISHLEPEKINQIFNLSSAESYELKSAILTIASATATLSARPIASGIYSVSIDASCISTSSDFFELLIFSSNYSSLLYKGSFYLGSYQGEVIIKTESQVICAHLMPASNPFSEFTSSLPLLLLPPVINSFKEADPSIQRPNKFFIADASVTIEKCIQMISQSALILAPNKSLAAQISDQAIYPLKPFNINNIEVVVISFLHLLDPAYESLISYVFTLYPDAVFHVYSGPIDYKNVSDWLDFDFVQIASELPKISYKTMESRRSLHKWMSDHVQWVEASPSMKYSSTISKTMIFDPDIDFKFLGHILAISSEILVFTKASKLELMKQTLETLPIESDIDPSYLEDSSPLLYYLLASYQNSAQDTFLESLYVLNRLQFNPGFYYFSEQESAIESFTESCERSKHLLEELGLVTDGVSELGDMFIQKSVSPSALDIARKINLGYASALGAFLALIVFELKLESDIEVPKDFFKTIQIAPMRLEFDEDEDTFNVLIDDKNATKIYSVLQDHQEIAQNHLECLIAAGVEWVKGISLSIK